jgi:2-methylisocitrate lyase-like PEP mutase family enzyme
MSATVLHQQFRQQFRSRLIDPTDGLLHVLGAYDAWSARLMEWAGFEAVYMSGFGVAASSWAVPDLGLITMSEMAQHAEAICSAVRVPVIADADNGYGGINNVRRCVQYYERAGVAALQLEDQVSPKRCGHFPGKEVISRQEMVAKIKVARTARSDEQLVILARTDANAVEGIERTLERGWAYLEAGADALLIEAPRSLLELEKISRTFSGKIPLVYNMVESGLLPELSAQQLEGYGFRLVLYSTKVLLAVTAYMCNMLTRLAEQPTASLPALPFEKFLDLIRLQDYREMGV